MPRASIPPSRRQAPRNNPPHTLFPAKGPFRPLQGDQTMFRTTLTLATLGFVLALSPAGAQTAPAA
ncbi:hypothetical protein VF13_38730, partial [Nostoc linckia z16]